MTNGNDAAFARPAGEVQGLGHNTDSPGLTKREYFAAMAMQGNLAAGGDLYPDVEHLCKKSVEYADALIEALNENE